MSTNMAHFQDRIEQCLASMGTHVEALNKLNGELAELYDQQAAENGRIGFHTDD